jgi:hypothetical protein
VTGDGDPEFNGPRAARLADDGADGFDVGRCLKIEVEWITDPAKLFGQQ